MLPWKFLLFNSFTELNLIFGVTESLSSQKVFNSCLAIFAHATHRAINKACLNCIDIAEAVKITTASQHYTLRDCVEIVTTMAEGSLFFF